MHELIIGLVILFWIFKGIYRFFQWVARSVRGTSAAPAGPAATPAAPMPPRSVPPPPVAPRQKEPRPAGPVPERPAAPTPSAFSSLADSPALTPAPPPLAPLFSSTDDLVRAFILSEVLGPPLSRRQSPQK